MLDLSSEKMILIHETYLFSKNLNHQLLKNFPRIFRNVRYLFKKLINKTRVIIKM